MEELRTVRQWAGAVYQSVSQYQSQARRLDAILSGDLPRASAFLGRRTDALHAFIAERAPSSGSYVLPTATPYAVGSAESAISSGDGPSVSTGAPVARGGRLAPIEADEDLFRSVEDLRAETEAREASELARLRAAEAERRQATAKSADPSPGSGTNPPLSPGTHPETSGSAEVERGPESVEGGGSPERRD